MNNQTSPSLTRREVIRRSLIVAGFGATATSSMLIAGCELTEPRAIAAQRSEFSAADIAWLDEVAETILPATDTPGAKAAEVGAFIAVMVSDTYDPAERQAFRNGMLQLEGRALELTGTGFMAASPAARLELLELLDAERAKSEDHYFAKIKALTVFGYFTSEIGYTQALRYVETPGRYDPCVEHAPGETSWARHA